MALDGNGIVNMSGSGTPPSASKVSDVREKEEVLAKGISYLEELSKTLVGRLSPVLPEVRASESNKKEEPKTYRCPLSHDLRDLADRVDAVNDLLVGALENLQI